VFSKLHEIGKTEVLGQCLITDFDVFSSFKSTKSAGFFKQGQKLLFTARGFFVVNQYVAMNSIARLVIFIFGSFKGDGGNYFPVC